VLPLLLTACSKDEVIAPVADSGKAISFGTVLAPASRGEVVNKAALQLAANGFTVVAYDQGNDDSWNTFKTSIATVSPSGGNFMNNTKVTWDDSLDPDAWTYTPVKFWPGLKTHGGYGHVTFFAYGGKASGDLAISLTATDKYPKITHETPPAADQQVDLVADVLFDRYWGHADGNPVKFQFEHILSKIGFKAKLDADYSTLYGATVKVTNLKVKYGSAVVKEADYNFNTDSDAPTGKGGWNTTTGTTNFTGNEDSDNLVPTSGVTLNHSTSVELNETTKYLMLIPQSVAKGDLKVELEYEVTVNSSAETYKETCDVPAIAYAMGTAYTYTFNIELRTVEFDTEINVSNVWVDGSSAWNDIDIK
jgi:hypothetical protein